ncbi:MAG: tRNA (adenosine(37)-N6)-dimethylallyltransferase MiaA [Patescibacteria group bacterium]
MIEKLPKILVVCGPTCSGKTGVGIALAKRFGGEVIAADSRTVYRGMDIGTAKPTADVDSPPYQGGAGGGRIESLFSDHPRMVDGVPHWGFDLVNPDEPFTVSQYQEYADKKIAEILDRGNVPIIVGGTGLYIRAIVDRPNFAGAAPDPLLRSELEAMSDNDLLEEIALRDPDAAAAIDDRNRRRLVRALEILRTTGGTLAEHQEFSEPIYDVLQIGMDVERSELFLRIDQRVDEMIGQGLIDEVRGLLERYGAESQAMTGIGYRQIADFFAKKESLRDAVLRIKYDTRHYAKRQETWFRRDERIVWVKTEKQAMLAVEKFLNVCK